VTAHFFEAYNFATRAWQTYREERGLELGLPPPEDD
jgi:hypothetical protein